MDVEQQRFDFAVLRLGPKRDSGAGGERLSPSGFNQASTSQSLPIWDTDADELRWREERRREMGGWEGEEKRERAAGEVIITF